MSSSSHPTQPFLLILFFLSCIFLLKLCPVAYSISFEFTRFDHQQVVSCKPGTGGGICIQGDATILNSDVIQLTWNDTTGADPYSRNNNSVGRATFSDPIRLWDSTTRELTNFTTHFSFLMKADKSNASDVDYGDGMAFFLSPYPSKIPSNPGEQLLGLFDKSTAQQSFANKIVAVEFDTWDADSWDPDGDHVGIDINSIESAATTAWNSSMNDGRIVHSWVTYDSTTLSLSVFFSYEANVDISNLKSCLSYKVDLREILPERVAVGFSSSSFESKEVHYLLSWGFNSSLGGNRTTTNQPKPSGNKNVTSPSTTTPQPDEHNKINDEVLKIGLSIAAAVVAVVVLLLVIAWFYFKWFAKNKKRTMSDIGERPTQEFSYNALVAATNTFSEDRRLGAGGSGAVYSGFLTDLGTEVAIKRFSRESARGKKAFEDELNVISNLRHRNLVKLLGWCHDNGELLLVYELMPNRSLDYWLFGTDPDRILPWSYRYNIALGLASALRYLHEEWEKCVIHRDIKSSNVMLDLNFNARLGDFGLARFTDHGVGSKTTTLFGTVGYMAPECYQTGKSSKESDMYSFGVVLLEIASGRRASEVQLVDWIWQNHQKQTLLRVVDANMELDQIGKDQAVRLMLVGLWCSNSDPRLRPSINEAISSLDMGGPLPCDDPSCVPADLFSSATSSGRV